MLFSDGRDIAILIDNGRGKRLRERDDGDDDDMVSGLQINFPGVC